MQNSIAQEVARLNSLIAALDEALIIHEKSEKALRSSLLAAAFRGKLVPQDLHEEPATVLLDRISSESVRTNGNKPSRGRTPRRGAAVGA
jgi:type I restriction enzyme S subunit